MSRVYGKTTTKDKKLFAVFTLFTILIVVVVVLAFAASQELRNRPFQINLLDGRLVNNDPLDKYGDWNTDNPDRFKILDMNGYDSILVNGSIEDEYYASMQVPESKNFTISFNSTRSLFMDYGDGNRIGVVLSSDGEEVVFIGLKDNNLFLNDNDLGEDLGTDVSYDAGNTYGTMITVYYSNPYIVIEYFTFNNKIRVYDIGSITIDSISLVADKTSCEYVIINPFMTIVKA